MLSVDVTRYCLKRYYRSIAVVMFHIIAELYNFNYANCEALKQYK